MGGKTNQSTSQTTVPADVLSRYDSVNQQAQQTAATPFQTYSTDPNSFVAPLTPTQQSGIAGTNAAASLAQPYYTQATDQLLNAQSAAQPYYGAAGSDITGAQSSAAPLQSQAASGFQSALAGAQPYNMGATGLALAGAQAVNPTALNAASIDQYISPYLSTVLGSTSALLNQNNQQQQGGQLGNAIMSGAFGGDRAGIAAANLEQQQNLGNASIYSGIANDAYTNALSTAQGQQSLGLSAAQANRAALSGAAGQLQSIGQQGYEQGTGTAGAQAALGQQEFGQGITASQAQSGLGSLIYNTGANTSQALAGLGSGAQSSALEGAQAQLAAGQQQQQTQQAGLGALYNQFLQQQSYPFQVSQYLANIAEGTGALSGQTTTTTQPGSLFSDRRLKDDVEKVGETFDGQPIYRFKYKGDKTAHLGLMAQDVEKHEPGAVGLSGGYKTVNYDKATDKAASRGHFAGGGVAGFDPQLMGQILQNGQGMYGPYLSALSGGVASAGAGPYGGVGRVPSSNVPVSHLSPVETRAAPQQSVLHQAATTGDDLTNLYKTGSSVAGLFKPKANADSSSSLASDLSASNDDWSDGPSLYRGGLAKRYASGGMPYQGGLAIDIPDETPDVTPLRPADIPQAKNSTGDDLADMAKIAATVAKFAMARGGYADGGSPDDLPGYDPAQVAQSNDPLSLGNILATIGHVVKTTDGYPVYNSPGNYTVSKSPVADDWDASSGNIGNHVSHGDMVDLLAGKKSTDIPTPVSRSRGLSGHGAHQKDSWSAGPPSDFGSDPLDATTTSDIASAAPLPVNTPGGLSIAAPPAAGLGLSQQPPDTSAMAPTSPNPIAGLGADAGNAIQAIAAKVAPKGGYIDRLTHGDEQTLIPFLTGLAAMTGAPTRNVGTALAQGLGAGANAYQKLQTQQQELAKTQAGIGLTQAQAAQTAAQASQQKQVIAKNLLIQESLGLLRKDPNGPIADAYGNRYSPTDAHAAAASALTGIGAPVGAAPAASTYKYVGPNMSAAAPTAQRSYFMDAPVGGAVNPNRVAASEAMANDVDDAGAKSASDIVNLNEQAAALFSPARKGVLSQGALTPIFEPWVAPWNAAMTSAGHPEWAINGLGDTQIAQKMQLGQAAAQATAAGERAFGALKGFESTSAGPHLDPSAAAMLVAQQATLSTKALDKRNALNELRTQGGNFETQGVLNAFDKDYTPAMYNNMRDSIAKVYLSPDYQNIRAGLSSSPGSPEYKKSIATLNAVGTHSGVPNLSRAFVGQ